MEKKILFITSYPINSISSASVRNSNLILGFLKNEIFVTIISPDIPNSFSFDGFDNYEIVSYKLNTSLTSLKEGQASNSKILNVIKSILLKVYRKFSILKLAGQSLKLASKIKIPDHHYDIVVTSSDPIASHLFFNKIKENISYNKWFQYWGDPLAHDITNKTIYPKFYRKIYENRILKKADQIIYVSPFTLQHQQKAFIKLKNKMNFIPPASREPVIYPILEKEKIVLSYSGGYSSYVRDIVPLYNSIRKSPYLELIISGSSDLSLLSRSNIIINKPLPYINIAQIEETSDVIVILLNTSGTQIPSKLYYTASTNKDILVLVNRLDDPIVGYLSKFDRFDIILNREESISEYLKGISKERLGKKEPLKSFSPKVIAQFFLELDREQS